MWKFNEKCDSFVGPGLKNPTPGHKFLKKSSKNAIFSIKIMWKISKNYKNYMKNKRKVRCGGADDWILDLV